MRASLVTHPVFLPVGETRFLRPASGASVLVNYRDTSTSADIYSTEAGTELVSNPLVTDVSGRVSGWVIVGSYDLVVSDPSPLPSFAPYLVPIEPVRGTPQIDLGGVESTAQFQTSSASLVDVTGMTKEVETSGQSIEVFADDCLTSNGSAAVNQFCLLQDGVIIRTLLKTLNAGQIDAFEIKRALTPDPGLHTYKLQMLVTAGTGTLNLFGLDLTELQIRSL